MAEIDLEPLTWRSWVVLGFFLLTTVFVIRPAAVPIPYPSIHAFKAALKPGSSQAEGSSHGRSKLWRTVRFNVGMKVAPWISIVVLLASTAIHIDQEVVNGFVGSNGIEPYAIVILIFSLAYICISLDKTGVLSYVALAVTKRWGKKGRHLLLGFFILSALMAALTSNDVVVLCLTPIICYFAEATSGIDPVPYLIAEFVAANTASMALYIGNPTNIIVAQANGISFLAYSAWMVLPFFAAAFAGLAVLYIVCLSKIPKHIDACVAISPASAITRPRLAKVGVALLALCLGTLSVASFFGVAVWIVTLPFALLMLIIDIVCDLVAFRNANPSGVSVQKSHLPDFTATATTATAGPEDTIKLDFVEEDKCNADHKDVPSSRHLSAYTSDADNDAIHLSSLGKCTVQDPSTINAHTAQPEIIDSRGKKAIWSGIKCWASDKRHEFETKQPTLTAAVERLPYGIIPFSIGMFIIVESLSESGWTSRLSWVLVRLCPSPVIAVFSIGIVSALACNILNNLPMTILFARALMHPIFDSAVSDQVHRGALFALIIGSNLGANCTLVGSLAGLMFQDITRQKNNAIDYWTFFKWCLPVLPVQILVSCAVLAAEMAIVK